MTRLNAVLSLAAGLLLALVVAACADRPAVESRQTRSEKALRAGKSERFDQPDHAEAYYRARRQPSNPSIVPMEAYRTARLHRRTMARHSVVLDRVLPSLEDTEETGGSGREDAGALPSWEPLGPGNIGGRTRGFVIVPTSPTTMFVGGVSGGVWKTTDGGASWSTATDELANLAVNALAIDPSDELTLYAGTGEGYFREEQRGTGLPLRGAGIFKSLDGGASWTQLESTHGVDFQWVNDLVVSRNNRRRVFAATRTGVWRSSDAGQSWQRVLESRAKGGCLDLAARTDTATDYLFASCGTFEQATIYRQTAAESDDAWEPVLAEAGMGRTSLAIAPSNQEVVYALAASNVPGKNGLYQQGLHAVFRSTRGGSSGSWSARLRNSNSNKLSTYLLHNPITCVYVECGLAASNSPYTMGWYTNVIAVDPADPEVVWAAGVDLFRSDNGGAAWGVASYWWADERWPSFVHADQHNIVFHPGYNGSDNQTLFAANDGGVYRTDNARAPVGRNLMALCSPGSSEVRFANLNHGLGVTQFYHGVPFPDGHRYLGGTQDNGTLLGSEQAGSNGWSWINGGDGGYVAVDPSRPNVVYAESQYFNFSKSRDGGVTFEAAREGVSDSFLFVTPFVLDSAEPTRLWTGGLRMWRTDNSAGTWKAASSWLGGWAQVSAIAIAPGHPEIVVAGTNEGAVLRCKDALAAHGGTDWQLSKPRDGFVTWLAIDPHNPDGIWATYGGFGGQHVLFSDDGGSSWEARDGSGVGALPDIPVHCIVVDPIAWNRLFLGTDLGVFVSTDRGASWAVENTGFATAVTESLSLLRATDSETYLFAFTHGRGAWRVKVPPLPPPQLPRRHLRS